MALLAATVVDVVAVDFVIADIVVVVVNVVVVVDNVFLALLVVADHIIFSCNR